MWCRLLSYKSYLCSQITFLASCPFSLRFSEATCYGFQALWLYEVLTSDDITDEHCGVSWMGIPGNV